MSAELELERVPLQEGQLNYAEQPQEGQSQQQHALEEVVVLEARDGGADVGTSGRAVPVINWGEKRMSPRDLQVTSV
jgi:hypothetical protein